MHYMVLVLWLITLGIAAMFLPHIPTCQAYQAMIRKMQGTPCIPIDSCAITEARVITRYLPIAKGARLLSCYCLTGLSSCSYIYPSPILVVCGPKAILL